MFSKVLRILALGVIAQVASAPDSTKHPDAKLGAVASESSICSKIGIDILKKGGNAADAVSSMRLHLGSRLTS